MEIKRQVRRTIPLTHSQFDALREAFVSAEEAGNVLANMLQKYLSLRAKRQDEAWDQVFQIAGLERSRHSLDSVRINWISKSIDVLESPDEKKDGENTSDT